MPSNFPTSLDVLNNPTATTSLNDVNFLHADQHANANDAIEAIEGIIGVTGSAVTTSIEYRLAAKQASLVSGTNIKTINSTTLLGSGDLVVEVAGAAATAETNAKAYADTLVVNLWDDRGSYDASVNTFPASGGSGTAGAVLKGDIWMISVAGTLGGSPVVAGDTVRTLVDTPGQTASNWSIQENNIGYITENTSNKVTSLSGASTDTQYPSAKLAYDQLALKAPLISPSFTTPALGEPSSGALHSCTSNTEAANNNSTQLATTAYADRLTNGTLPGAFTSLSASGKVTQTITGSEWAEHITSNASGAISSFSDGVIAFGAIGSELSIIGAGTKDTFAVSSTNGKSIVIRAPDGQTIRLLNGTTEVGTISSTGLAVTGSISATTTGKVGTTLGVGNATPAASGAGITFPATQSASSDPNTFDDYEEGTWEASLTPSTGTITLSLAGSTLIGSYTKTGRLVTCKVYITVLSVSSPTGVLLLGGLPFPTADVYSNSAAGVVAANGLAASATTSIQLRGIKNSATALIQKFAAGSQADLAGDVQADSDFFITFSYEV